MTKNHKLHIGVYGIYINDKDEVLLIKKSRGPYKGKYDLPGGKIEDGESVEDALRREFAEEVGVEITNLTFLGTNEYKCNYLNSRNESVDFHHKGSYFLVKISSDEIKTLPDGEDSLGAELVKLSKLDEIDISPIAEPMIREVIINSRG